MRFDENVVRKACLRNPSRGRTVFNTGLGRSHVPDGWIRRAKKTNRDGEADGGYPAYNVHTHLYKITRYTLDARRVVF